MIKDWPYNRKLMPIIFIFKMLCQSDWKSKVKNIYSGCKLSKNLFPTSQLALSEADIIDREGDTILIKLKSGPKSKIKHWFCGV